MSLPPVPGDHAAVSKAEDHSFRQVTSTGTVLSVTAGVALASALYLVTSTADAYLDVGDRITVSVLSFALAFLLTAFVGFRNELNTARSRFLEALIASLSSEWVRKSGAGSLTPGRNRALQSFFSWATSIGTIRGLSRIDYERLTALVREVSVVTFDGIPDSRVPDSLQDEPVPDELAQEGMDAFGMLERHEFDEAATKLSALRDLAVEQLGPLHLFTLRIRACIAYLHVETGSKILAKNELQNLLRDQLKRDTPDSADVAWTVQLLAETNEP
jgi:hypothetical protein